MAIPKKIKPILPSLRERKRYLVFEIISNSKISSFPKVKKAIWQNLIQFCGEFGVANAGVMILSDKMDLESQKGMIRVNHNQVHMLKSALALTSNIDRQNVIIKSIGVSGIMKKAENKYMAS